MPPNVIEGPYVRDLLDQPAALQRTWENMKETVELSRVAQQVRDGSYRRIVLTGMGSSQHALYPLHLQLIQSGQPSYLVETAELIHYQHELLATGTIVIAISQSGHTAEIVTLLDMARGRVPLIGITNTPGSPLANAADVLLAMYAGPEATVSCKTYVTSLMLLEWLGAHLTGTDPGSVRDHLSGASPAVARYLESWREHVAEAQTELEGVHRIFVTGRGASLAAAQTGGLILKESVRFAAEGMSCPAFRHGPFEVLRDDVMVVVMEGDVRTAALNRRLAGDVRRAGGRAKLVDVSDASLRSILEILPVQMMTLALGSLGGREAGKFALNTKVTTVE